MKVAGSAKHISLKYIIFQVLEIFNHIVLMNFFVN